MGSSTLKYLTRTLLAFPSRIGAFILKPRESIAPAVDFPIPGNDSSFSEQDGMLESNSS